MYQLDAQSVEFLSAITKKLTHDLDASICAYADVEEDQNNYDILGEWKVPNMPSLIGHHQLDTYGVLTATSLRSGKPLIINNVVTDLGEKEAAPYLLLNIHATVCFPLVKYGRLTAMMAVHSSKPRVWTNNEIALVKVATEKSWDYIMTVRSAPDEASQEHWKPAADFLSFVTQKLAKDLGASMSAYASVEEDQNNFDIIGEWKLPLMPSQIGHHQLDGYGATAGGLMRSGKPFITNNMVVDLGEKEAAPFLHFDIHAIICFPLIKNDRLTSMMAVHSSKARVWTEAEISLVRGATEASWEYIERVSNKYTRPRAGTI